MMCALHSDFGLNFNPEQYRSIKITDIGVVMTGVETRILKLMLIVWLSVLSLPCAALAWWNDEWTIRKKITLDTTPTGSAIADPIGTTALLIRLHDGDFQFANAKDDGGDIRFVAEDDKTLLPYHIEKFDSLLDEAFVWVKLADLKPGTKTSFWMYYGNSGPKAVKADDPKGTYDADAVLVYHFAGHGQPPLDATKYANNAQNAGIPDDGALIGTGLRVDGKSFITIPASPSLAWTNGAALTWSAWIKFGAAQPDATIFDRPDGPTAFRIGVDNGVPFVEVTGASGTQRSPAGAPITPNSWRHLAVVAAGSKIKLFLDGEPYSELNAAIPALSSAGTIGVDSSAAPAHAGFSGELDELEISKIARPAGFIKLAALNQAGDRAPKLLAIGEDEQKASFISGYFAVILKSVTPDGWVVICILMMMAVLSWAVMINRFNYLNRVGKGNAAFLREWHHLARDLTALDHGDAENLRTLGGRVDPARQRAMRNAPLYRIYHIGVEEIRHRFATNSDVESKFLSAQSIQAIRASLDGGLVRETQKLSRLMVFLTLSISGGPFLGLLGTVIGVMITFAAIAAAGDVNVNAIAPGIAAALVATVAGLSVAIPALFGYNYLISRIKDATSDMHVFVDEFVTKTAEFYSSTPENTNWR
jgi:biopolymer transport protein ExbB